MEQRLQKILARAGYGSRRTCEEFISNGQITVNGQIATLGMKADPDVDRIEFNNKLVSAPEQLKYIALYKPRGVISAASSPEGRQTVRDLVDESGRLYPVGRLDADSEGLILLTNDGELTNRLTHPRYGHKKEYNVLVAVHPEEEQLKTWRRGVVLEDGYRTAPAKVSLDRFKGKGAWLRVIMGEGRKRQIREIGSRIGLPIVKIIRTRIATLQLGSLKPGQSRPLTRKEIDSLKKKE
jgi:23S rRNA pseudouridine2605 synthase